MKLKLISILSVVLLTAGNSFAQTCQAPQPGNICNRACWAARAPTCAIASLTTVNRAIIHHTAVASHWNTTSQSTSATSMRSIQNYHIDNNGWCDIGYNFLVDKLGNIFEGR